MQETEEKMEIISRRESRTDSESGFYKRKGKTEGMHYLSHETVDSKNGTIIDVAATAGNVLTVSRISKGLIILRKIWNSYTEED